MSAARRRSTLLAEGVLRSSGPGTWTYLDLKEGVRAVFGASGKVRVRATLSGRRFESTAIPWRDGSHILLFTKPIQSSLGVGPGSSVRLELTPIWTARPLRLPTELERSLRESSATRAAFAKLAPSHRRELAEYVGAAKNATTRRRRAARVLARLTSRNATRPRNARSDVRGR